MPRLLLVHQKPAKQTAGSTAFYPPQLNTSGLYQKPKATRARAGSDSDPNFESYVLFRAQSPDTGRGLHARSWRANRDVDVKRQFLGFCLRVQLLALWRRTT